MKKFFEMPVVEITVFDVEDVITTSVVEQDTLAQDANVQEIVNTINGVDGYSASAYHTSTYSW